MISSLNNDLEVRRHRQRESNSEGTNHAGTSILCVSSPGDFDAARSILARQREWLEGLLGGSLATFQPSAVREYVELERFYQPPNGRLLVAMAEGEAVGVVGVHRLGPKVAELKRMYVDREARGLGMGRALAVAAVEVAGEMGFDILRLETHPDHMPAAVRLYQDLGFRETEPYYSVVGVEGLLTMELRLDSGTRAKSLEPRRCNRGRQSSSKRSNASAKHPRIHQPVEKVGSKALNEARLRLGAHR
jgi:putative acetyltransferase